MAKKPQEIALDVADAVKGQVVIKKFRIGVEDMDGDGDKEVFIDLKIGVTVSPRTWWNVVRKLFR